MPRYAPPPPRLCSFTATTAISKFLLKRMAGPVCWTLTSWPPVKPPLMWPMFELRALQRRYGSTDEEHAKAAFLAAYQLTPVVAQRIQAYADATRLRLACVYSCRPAGLVHVPALLASIGQRVVG